MSSRKPNAAQLQHYVPRHLIRGFLSDDPKQAAKDQVKAFNVQTGRTTVTGISNVMGERRYNEWWVEEDILLTIEPGVGKIEDQVRPMIDRVRKEHKLNLSSKEHADIALMLAFQFLRTRRMRDTLQNMEDFLVNAVKKRGWKVEQLEGYQPATEESIKQDHTRQQIRSLKRFTEAMAEKVFFLAEAPKGTSLYLGDNPVVMVNDHDKRQLGSIGLSVPFIQIYMPLASELLLCAYSKEVLGSFKHNHDDAMADMEKLTVAEVMSGKLPADKMKEVLDRSREYDGVKPLMESVRAGTPIMLEPDMVDKYNSLQVVYAVRWVIDSRGDFRVAEATLPARAQLLEDELRDQL